MSAAEPTVATTGNASAMEKHLVNADASKRSHAAVAVEAVVAAAVVEGAVSAVEAAAGSLPSVST